MSGARHRAWPPRSVGATLRPVTVVELHMISDATGATAKRLVQALEAQAPLDVLGYQYDIVCNGVELSSGAVRNHKPEIMYKAFEIVGHDPAFVDGHFGGMLSAFRYGAPPHAGIAPGVDRIVMLLAGAENIREVIMFPMNQRAEDLMMGAPSEPTNEQLRELGIRQMPRPERGQDLKSG